MKKKKRERIKELEKAKDVLTSASGPLLAQA